MDIFGTGQGQGKGFAEQRRETPEEQEAKAKAAAGLIGVALTIKYLPVVVLGVIFGKIVNAGARGIYGLGRIKTLLFGLLFFALFLFLCVGLPDSRDTSGQMFGLFFQVRSFHQLMVDALVVWNRFFDVPVIAKVFRFDLKHLRYQDITNYFWISMAAAAALVLWLEGWAYFRPEDRTRRQEVGLGTQLCQIPAQGIAGTLHIVAGRWFHNGRGHAWALRTEGLRAIFRVFLGVIFLGLVAAFVTAYVLPKFMPISLVNFIGYLTFGPAVGTFLGFCMGMSDLILDGSRILPALERRKTAGGEFRLGDDFRGRLYSLTERNLSYHVEVIAPTGSGKTNLLKNLIADRIHRGHGLIFLDLKAEFKVVEWMMRAAHAAGRQDELRLVSLANRELSVPYNPIKHGSAPEIHSQLMNSMSWSEDYYRKISSIALMTLLRGLCEYRDRMGESFHLGHLFDLLNEPGLLRAFNERLTRAGCPAAREVAMLAEKLDRPSERDKLTGLVANLGLLIHSAAGPLISQDVSSGSFDFREAVDEGRITYVLMNSMKLRETASVFGKMILQDLMRLAGDRYSELDGGKQHKPVTLIIDEFAAFAIPEFIEFMDRARGAGIGIVFAHQSRADLRSITPEFQDRIEANSNTVIVSGVKSSEDAEYYAGMLGTRTTTKETVQVEDGFLGHNRTGMKSLRDVEEYVVHPNALKDLQQGEVFTVSRTVDPRWAMVKIPAAPEFAEHQVSSLELMEALKRIRRAYTTSSQDKYLDLDARGPGLTKAPKKSAPVPMELGTGTPESNDSEPDLWS